MPETDRDADAGRTADEHRTTEAGAPADGLAESPEEASTLNVNLAELPEDPDERRRAVETILPPSHP